MSIEKYRECIEKVKQLNLQRSRYKESVCKINKKLEIKNILLYNPKFIAFMGKILKIYPNSFYPTEYMSFTSGTKCHAENRCKNYSFVTVRSYERIRTFKCLEKGMEIL